MELTNDKAREMIIAIMDTGTGVSQEVYDLMLEIMDRTDNMDIRPYLKSINGMFYIDKEEWNEDIMKEEIA